MSTVLTKNQAKSGKTEHMIAWQTHAAAPCNRKSFSEAVIVLGCLWSAQKSRDIGDMAASAVPGLCLSLDMEHHHMNVMVKRFMKQLVALFL